MKGQLSAFPQGKIAFEYTIPRIGHRVDVVCIIDGLIFLLEFKVGGNEYRKSTDDQVKQKARGNERYGLLASSEGKRLRGEGIWVPADINHVGWFLNGKEHVDSSYFLEVAASEFKIQGLEIDYGLLAWDADLRYSQRDFDYYRFRGASWNHINLEQRQKYLKNAYRVLLTRSRQGLVIYVPLGADPADDPTRDRKMYDGIYEYLRSCGIERI